jgi:hypothetical protein
VHALSPRLTAAAVVGAVAGLALASSTLAAQAATRPTFGLAAGATVPTGDFGDGFGPGFNVGAHVGFRSATMPVGFRLEGTFHRNEAKGTNGLNFNTIAGTANVVAGPAAAAGGVSPYVIGGAGVYNLKIDAGSGGSESITKFGLNGGAGVDLPLSGIGVFAEARFHYVFSGENGGSNINFIPLSVGIRF